MSTQKNKKKGTDDERMAEILAENEEYTKPQPKSDGRAGISSMIFQQEQKKQEELDEIMQAPIPRI